MNGKNPMPAAVLCWICGKNEANSGEHKTKRSDLVAVLGSPTQTKPFYFHDHKRRNKPIKSLNAKILKAPVRICHHCNTNRTQPNDRAWECMSGKLRSRSLVPGQWVRANKIFPYDTQRCMIDVHLFFLKLFGCILCEAEANGNDVPIDVAPFSKAIIDGRPHPEVHLQFGKCDGAIGRSDLICRKTDHGGMLASWLYELDSIAVSVIFAQAGHWQNRPDLWHPLSTLSSKRFLIADFMSTNRAVLESERGSKA